MRVLLSIALVLAANFSFAAAPTAVKVLIITGDHSQNWKETTPELRSIIANAGHSVDVTEAPQDDLTAEKLDAYDLLVLNYRETVAGARANPDSVWTDANKEAFEEAVSEGTGLLVLQRASSAFPGDGRFEQMIAGGLRGDDAVALTPTVTVTIQKDHPVTRGVASFDHGTDELFTHSRITAGSEVVATGFDGKEQDEPVLWVNRYGKGRVVHYGLGRDTEAMKSEGYRRLLVQAAEWAGEKGFRDLFDGKTLTGWEGGSRYWSVENGAITGQNPSWQPMDFHDFLCSVEEFEDFELRLEAKVIGQRNSGVTVRTRRERLRTTQIVMGYEIDMGMQRWGWVYEEGGTRRLLNPEVQERLQPNIQAALRPGQFNDFVIRAIGNRIETWLNGVYFEYVDTDEKLANEMRKGTIGFQLHYGTPQIVSFRNIRIKELP